MRDTTVAALALRAWAACGAAWASGEGNSGADRGKQAKHTPAICRRGEHLIAAPQADGSLRWACRAASASPPPARAG